MKAATKSTTKSKVLACVAVCVAIACVSVAMLAGCSPKQSDNAGAYSGDSTSTQQGDFSFSMDSDCMTCHMTQAQASADPNCFLQKGDHASIECVTCHDDESGLTSAHKDVQYGDKEPKRLKSTTTDSEICLSCHGSYEELAQKTADSTVLTDSKGTTVNPHEVPGLNEKHASIQCTDCHQPHSGEDAAAGAADTCTTCHHTGVYECYTCHD